MKYSLQAAMRDEHAHGEDARQRQRQHHRQEGARIADAPSTRAASSISMGMSWK